MLAFFGGVGFTYEKHDSKTCRLSGPSILSAGRLLEKVLFMIDSLNTDILFIDDLYKGTSRKMETKKANYNYITRFNS